MDDRDLLREYVESRSEKAFAELVARHVDIVYATALRLVGDAAAAQDVAQTVFIKLARKAWSVREGNALSGWLYRTTYYAALNFQHSEQRRRWRETEAMKLSETDNTPSAVWDKLAPLLDEAMQQLNRKDQDALMLRYFEGKSVRETGAALALTEAAAQKRLDRAVEKLRGHFARGGVAVTSVIIVTALTARPAQAAPINFAKAVAGASLARAGGGGFIGGLTKLLFMTTQTKIILSAILLVALIMAIKIAWPAAWESTSAYESSWSASTVTKPAMAPATPGQISTPKNPAVANTTQPGAGPAQPAASLANPANEPRLELNTAILEAIRLMGKGNELALQTTFMPPDDLKHLEQVKGKTAEQLFNKINPQDNAAWLLAFQQIKDQTPYMSADGNEAVYELKPPVENYFSTITFVKIDGLWYWKTSTTEPPLWYQKMAAGR